jgi:acyl-CoA thioesterase-1
LQAIIDQVKTKYPQCKILIAGMLAPPNLGERYTTAFKTMFADLAQKNNARLLPFLLENVGGVPSLNLEDGIHPNPAGQKIVAQTVWKYLQPML